MTLLEQVLEEVDREYRVEGPPAVTGNISTSVVGTLVQLFSAQRTIGVLHLERGMYSLVWPLGQTVKWPLSETDNGMASPLSYLYGYWSGFRAGVSRSMPVEAEARPPKRSTPESMLINPFD